MFSNYFFLAPVLFLNRLCCGERPSSGHQRDAVGRVSWFASYFWGKGSTDLRPVSCERQIGRDNAYLRVERQTAQRIVLQNKVVLRFWSMG